ncbi:TPA: phosphoenolpyruvate synthase, partial [Candidatus Bathyarchaeota archaeon]|nr:phosphoenolpyruvate synthase [Candidatus Bathyarchaeota archaeon]
MSKEGDKFVLWFDEISKEDTPLVGGKSASLGEMVQKTRAPVPYGFATTASAYRHFIKEAGLREKIKEVLEELKDPNDTRTLQKVGKAIRSLIVSAKMPKDLEEEIKSAYRELSKRLNEEGPFVAVRSSATAEDLPDASFAGQQETFLNVSGEEEV